MKSRSSCCVVLLSLNTLCICSDAFDFYVSSGSLSSSNGWRRPLFMNDEMVDVQGLGGFPHNNNNITKNDLTVKPRRRSPDFPRSLYVTNAITGIGGPSRTLGVKVKWSNQGGKTQKANGEGSPSPPIVSIPSNRKYGRTFEERSLGLIEQAAQKTRLLNERFYARKDSFEPENMRRPPGLQDLSLASETGRWLDKFWITLPARFITCGAAYLSFPYIMALLDRFVTMAPDQLDDITSKFGPGIAILYGTFTSLTISILYQRQKSIQESVATEASLLVLILRNMIALFRGDRERTIEAGQTVADQIRTLVKSSRGAEMMQIMYTDPYSRLFELVNEYDETLTDKEHERKNTLMTFSRDTLRELTKVRSIRLTEEARALPPTHFLVLNVLTSLILLAYCINTLPIFDRVGGEPPFESALIFGLLTAIYILFYNFADDLNNPFEGVYQIRRSTAATHLLEAKWLIVNHPILKDDVDFEEVQEQSDGVLMIRTPGLGECLFRKDEFVVNGELQE
ncbi:hypothetical protein ACA910_022271 [Epithemia clementina (nom. ined.)]